MWKRKELKQQAKEVVKNNYWTAIVVCFLIALFTGEFGTSILGIWQSEDSVDLNYLSNNELKQEKTIESQEATVDIWEEIQGKVDELINENLNSVTKSQKYIFKIWDATVSFMNKEITVGVMLCIGALIAFLFTFLVADPLIVGGKRYFIKAVEGENPKAGVMADVFRGKHWLNIAVIMFLRNLYNALWYLTIVGGVIKTYEYRMIPYILADNPNIHRKEAFELSKKMMKGNKWKMFILDISFFGWYILSVLTFGLLSVLYVNPYNASTIAQLYETLKNEK